MTISSWSIKLWVKIVKKSFSFNLIFVGNKKKKINVFMYVFFRAKIVDPVSNYGHET